MYNFLWAKIWRFFNKYLLDTIVIFQTLTKWRSYLNSSLRKNEKKFSHQNSESALVKNPGPWYTLTATKVKAVVTVDTLALKVGRGQHHRDSWWNVPNANTAILTTINFEDHSVFRLPQPTPLLLSKCIVTHWVHRTFRWIGLCKGSIDLYTVYMVWRFLYFSNCAFIAKYFKKNQNTVHSFGKITNFHKIEKVLLAWLAYHHVSTVRLNYWIVFVILQALHSFKKVEWAFW